MKQKAIALLALFLFLFSTELNIKADPASGVYSYLEKRAEKEAALAAFVRLKKSKTVEYLFPLTFQYIENEDFQENHSIKELLKTNIEKDMKNFLTNLQDVLKNDEKSYYLFFDNQDSILKKITINPSIDIGYWIANQFSDTNIEPKKIADGKFQKNILKKSREILEVLINMKNNISIKNGSNGIKNIILYNFLQVAFKIDKGKFKIGSVSIVGGENSKIDVSYSSENKSLTISYKYQNSQNSQNSEIVKSFNLIFDENKFTMDFYNSIMEKGKKNLYFKFTEPYSQKMSLKLSRDNSKFTEFFKFMQEEGNLEETKNFIKKTLPDEIFNVMLTKAYNNLNQNEIYHKITDFFEKIKKIKKIKNSVLDKAQLIYPVAQIYNSLADNINKSWPSDNRDRAKMMKDILNDFNELLSVIVKNTMNAEEDKSKAYYTMVKRMQTILKYGILFSDILASNDNETIEEIMSKNALPVGSYVNKRQSGGWYINSYYGGAFGYNYSGDSSVTKGNFANFYVPIGLEYASHWRRRSSGYNLSLFLQFYDVGYLVNKNNLEVEKYDFNKPFSFGPGLIWGINDTFPVSIGTTYTYYLGDKEWRWNFFVAVDMPLFDFS